MNKNLELINKIQEGTRHTKEVEVTDDNNNTYNFTIRVLSSAEVNEIQKLQSASLKMNFTRGQTEMKNMNAAEVTEGNFKSRCQAIAYSLSVDDEIVSVDDVKTLSNKIFNQLYDAIEEFSDLKVDTSDIESFLKD